MELSSAPEPVHVAALIRVLSTRVYGNPTTHRKNRQPGIEHVLNDQGGSVMGFSDPLSDWDRLGRGSTFGLPHTSKAVRAVRDPRGLTQLQITAEADGKVGS